MIKYFCSGDIHSFFDLWMMSLHDKGFDENNSEHKIIVCGDLFDRGEECVKCYEFVNRMKNQNRLIYIRGNHEDLLIKCVHDLKTRGHTGQHHISNGTIKTLSHFLNCSEYDILCGCVDWKLFEEVTTNLISFINDNTVDYFELNDKIFVHGWVPTSADENNYEIVHDNWREGEWEHARWKCGFDCWRCKLIPQGKTVVCGHWHTSYGWSEFRGRSEWGPDAEFIPFIDNGIIAIDACTAYTKMVNVVVFNEGGDLIE